jgi:hypothetical protein
LAAGLESESEIRSKFRPRSIGAYQEINQNSAKLYYEQISENLPLTFPARRFIRIGTQRPVFSLFKEFPG